MSESHKNKSAKRHRQPDPPTMEEIITDIERSKTDDVLFLLDSNNSNPDDRAKLETTGMSDLVPSEDAGGAEKFNDDKSKNGSEANAAYSKVLLYLKLHNILKDSPRELQQELDDLEKLILKVSQSIQELKEKAQSVLIGL